MNELRVKVKDVKEFVRKKLHLYASGKGKRLFIALRAGPNVERYVVEQDGMRHGFTKVGDAVRFFNSI